MSHTTKINNAVFIHNGDFSGDVTITLDGRHELVIAFDTLRGFVAEYARTERIRALEQSNDKEALGL